MSTNHDLVEDIRDDSSRRAATFDLASGYHIAPGAEAAAWAQPMRDHLGPARLLGLACGTTRLVHDLGHEVAALRLARLLAAAGFVDVRVLSHTPIARAQRSGAGLRNRLGTRIYDRFVTLAGKPGEQRRL
jgi:hypothetical protein